MSGRVVGLGKAKVLLQVAPSPDSNIRVLRVSGGQGSRLWKCLAEDSHFHHRFWEQNNLEFSQQEESKYCEYVQGKYKQFQAYHWECWKRNWRAVLAGYSDLFESLITKVPVKAVKAVIK